MARKRNCESKSWATAIGSSIRFIGVVNKRKYQDLLKAIQWDWYREEKGNDLIIYLPDDWCCDELDTLRERHWDYLMGILDDDNLEVKRECVQLSKHLPSYLPKFRMSAEEWYEHFLESSEREEDGTFKNCRTHYGEGLEEDKPEIVKVYSFNEYKTNGAF